MAGAITVDVTPEDLLIGFPLLRPGTYNAQVTDVTVGPNKAGTNDMATLIIKPQGKVPCVVENAEGQPEEKMIEGRVQLKTYCAFTGKAARSTLALQVATRKPNVGFRKDTDGAFKFFPEEFAQFKGSPIKVVVEHEDYEGKPQAKIKAMYPA